MKRHLLRLASLALALCLSASLAAATPAHAVTYKTVPKAVAEFYGDVMGMFGKLMKDLNGAKDASAVAKAFRDANKGAVSKRLPSRYAQLSAKYPEFFRDNDGSDGSWTPPADWLKISAEYEAQMKQYGESAGNLSAFMGTSEVEEAMGAFGATMEKMNPSEGE
jgi:hypothetical protein